MTAPDAEALARALAARGLPARVEARERLAVLLPDAGWPGLADVAERRALHQLATQHGFTHVALELDGGDAPPDPAGA